MTNRFAFHRIPYLVLISILLFGMAGCFGGGGNTILTAQVSFSGIRNINYDPSIPVTILIKGQKTMHVTLALSYRQGTEGPYLATSAFSGSYDPTILPKLVVPSTGMEVTYFWHAIADLGNGEQHDNIWLTATVTTEDGSISEVVFGPITFDFTSSLSGKPPPYVPDTALPGSFCGAEYDQQLPVEGGYPPFEWTMFPPGVQLPHFLELTHDGHVLGTFPDDYGPTTITFATKALDSNPVLQRESAGWFTIFVDCEEGPGCASPPEILFSSLPPATEGESYGYQCNADAGDGELTWAITAGNLPDGLELTTAGMITGVCSVGSAGLYEITLQVCDSCPDGIQCDSVDVILEVIEPAEECDPGPTIITTSLPSAIEGQFYDQSLQAANGHGNLAWEVTDGDLPLGLMLHGNGQLSGIPSDGTGGDTGETYFFTVQVCDSCPIDPQCDHRELSLVVGPFQDPCGPGPEIATISPIDDASESTQYDFTFDATGGEAPLTWILNNPDELPDSLLWSSIGAISGIPDAGTAGVYNLDITVKDSCWEGAQTDNDIFELTVHGGCDSGPEITTTSISEGLEGASYDFLFQATGGHGQLTWTRIGGSEFPAGLTLETSGQLHGIPEAGTAGNYNDIEIQVADSCPSGAQTASNLYNLVIYPGCADGPSITTTELDSATIGVEYNFTMQATDGEGTLYWSIVEDEDQLPASLLFSDGVISGIPDTGTDGTYTIHFKVCDSCPVEHCDEILLDLEVFQPCAPGPTITTTDIPVAYVDVPYEFQFEADGGEGQLTWSQNPFTLPLSFTVEPDGRLVGTASTGVIGDWLFTLEVRDECWSGPQYDNKNFTLVIEEAGCAPPPEITSDPSLQQPAGSIIEFKFVADNGEGELTWTIQNSVPPLPASLNLDPTGTLLGITDISDHGLYTIDIEVCDECADPGTQCDTQQFELTLQEATGCGAGPPEIQDLTIPTPIADNSPYSYTMNVTGGEGLLIWFGIGFPPNITINFATGEISGTVAPEEAGEYMIYIGVCDSCAPIPQCDSAKYYWNIL